MCQVETILSRLNLYTQKVKERPQVLYLKSRTEDINKATDVSKIVACDVNVIHIQEQVDDNLCGLKNEEKAIS